MQRTEAKQADNVKFNQISWGYEECILYEKLHVLFQGCSRQLQKLYSVDFLMADSSIHRTALGIFSF